MILFKKGFFYTIVTGLVLFIAMLIYASIFSASAAKKIKISKMELEKNKISIQNVIGAEFLIDESCTEYVKKPGKDRVCYCLVAQDTFSLIYDFLGDENKFFLIKGTDTIGRW